MAVDNQLKEHECKPWYELYKKWNKDQMSSHHFCKKNGLITKEFANWIYRFDPWHATKNKVDKEEKKKHELNLYFLYKASGISRGEFAYKNNVHPDHLTKIGTHIKYMRILEPGLYPDNFSTLEVPQPTEMQFIQIEPEQPKIKRELTVHEVISPPNDLELIIKKGVKVSISPEISNEQVISIIEFLRTL